jgi:hypothetical protein
VNVLNNYGTILPLYRWLSAEDVKGFAPSAEHAVFGVSLRSAQRLIRELGLVDENLTKVDIEAILVAVRRVSPEDQQRIKVTGLRLARYQFVELLLRIAHEKYPDDRIAVAFSKLTEPLKKAGVSYSADVDELFSQACGAEVNDALHVIVPLIATTFSKAFRNSACKGYAHVTLEDWGNVLKAIGFFATFDGFQTNMAAYAFRLGLETTADEQSNPMFQQMSFPEFERGLVAAVFLHETRRYSGCSQQKLAQSVSQLGKMMLGVYPYVKTRSLPRMASGLGKITSEDVRTAVEASAEIAQAKCIEDVDVL